MERERENTHQNRNTQKKPHKKRHHDHQHPQRRALHAKRGPERHGPQHDGELLVSQGERPQPQVRRRVRDAVEAEFDGVDGLVDLHFRVFEFFVLRVVGGGRGGATGDVFGDHGGVVGVGEAVAAVDLAVGVRGVVVFFLIVEGVGEAAGVADAAVALGGGFVVFVAEVEGLEEEEDGHLDDGEEDEGHLDACLSCVELFFGFDGAGLEEHVDEHVQQAGGVASDGIPINAPFVDDTEDEVAEDGLEEDHARHEVAPDVDLGLEESGVDERPH